MKNLIASPALMFNLFAVTLGLRDVFSEIYLSKSYSPEIILFIFSAVTILLAYLFRVHSTKSLAPFSDIRRESRKDKVLFFNLGITTFIAFILTVYGIKLIGAAIFSIIEHSIMPISTIFLGVFLLGERFRKGHLLGILICIVGIVLFFLETTQIEVAQRSNWFIGVCLSVICSYLTSLSSYYQKKLINNGVDLSVIMKYRFFPTFLILGLTLFFQKEMGVFLEPGRQSDLAAIAVIGVLTFALPMLFLCLGFVRASLQRFSAYILMIPIYTFILSALIIPNTRDYSSPYVIAGITTVFFGYLFTELNYFRTKDAA
ncbi:DMT family transporter [Oligoflexaceae bacterium]|nr:DMT family transporter [Oligoflexaceae bacterium]